MPAIRASLLVAIAIQICGFVEPAAAQRAITHSEASGRGAMFLVHFETATRCPATFGNGPSGTSVIISLDCRFLPAGSTATFDAFKFIRLTSPWAISSFSSSTGTVLSTPIGNDPFARVRISASAGARAMSTITVTIAPSMALLPAFVPQCDKALDQVPRDFVCHSDSDCTPTDDGKPRACSVECGNRCVLK